MKARRKRLLITLTHLLAEKPDLSLSDLTIKARAEKDELVATYGFLPVQAERLAQANELRLDGGPRA